MLSQLTQLKDTGIWIIELPKSSIRHYINEANDRINYTFVNSKRKRCLDGDYIEKADWQILGTITPDNISFDPAPYLPKILGHHYPDYLLGENAEVETLITDKNESLYTLLNSCGYYWVNPLGTSKYVSNTGSEFIPIDEYLDKLKTWKEFEDNLVTGLLLALIKK